MTLTHSYLCPHCEQQINAIPGPDFAIAGASPRPMDWQVYVLACPHCHKIVGSYAAPQQ